MVLPTTPDPDQQAIIEIEEGRHLVLAPPGCGKTFILAERVVHAHSRGVAYADMACLTFTNRASRSMSERVSWRTGNPVPPDMFVGNVHRFCANYLFEGKKIPQNSAVIDDMDAESIIVYLARLDPNEDNSRFASDIVDLQHAITQWESGMPAELIVHPEKLRVLDNPLDRHRVEMARAYARYKETDNLLDFEDLLEKAYLMARDEGEALHRYRWIQVDEVQDLNNLQFAIIDLFATEDANVVYLGDEQQAIFSFVGAKVEALELLKQRCSPNIHHLSTNHRSPKRLLEIYNAYAATQLGSNPKLLPRPVSETAIGTAKGDQNESVYDPSALCLFEACHHNLNALPHKEDTMCQYDNTPCTRCGRSCADEYRLTVSLARRYAAIDPDGRVAIIVPTNADADRMSREFGDTPHFKVSGRDLFSTPTMQFILSHLSVVANETCFIAWAKILQHLRVLPVAASARNMMRRLRANAITPTDLLYYDGSSYLLEFVKTFDTQEIVLFDTETTGLDISRDDIIQIAAIKVRQGHKVKDSEFNIIIETDKELPPIVGGHDNPMLSVYLESERHKRDEALLRFLDYSKGCVLVGHNVEFDFNILTANVRRTLGIVLPQERIRFDTLKLTRLVEPRLRVYKLERLLETLHLEGINSHNALDDVLATLSLMVYCREKADHYLPQQRQLLVQPEIRQLCSNFRQAYLPLFQHSHQRLYTESSTDCPPLIEELQFLYHHLTENKLTEPVEKWEHLIRYVFGILKGESGKSTLRQQLDSYLSELSTLREPDLALVSPDRFFIATAHKSKGLEFENVIVFSAVEGNYPYYTNIRNENHKGIKEDARRLYVAISRAKQRLCITYARTGSRGYNAKLSPFLQSIVPFLTRYAFDPATGRIVEVTDKQNKSTTSSQ